MPIEDSDLEGLPSGAPLAGTDLLYVVRPGAPSEDLHGTMAAIRAYLDSFYAAGFGDQPANAVFAGPTSGSAAAPAFRALVAADLPAQTESFVIACSDETTALTTGTAKVAFRMPYAFTVTAVRASLTTAQTSGSIFTVDINEGGATILSTKLTIDNTEQSSTTAVTAPVISDTALADDAAITIDIDQVGDGTAKGLKVVIIGRRA